MADEKISSAELREFTGLTDRRHRQIADAGYFPLPVKGMYEREKTLKGMFIYLRELLAKKDPELQKEERELKKAKRETAQEELAILRKQYVPKSEIGPPLRNLALHQRAVLQRKFESEVAPNLAGKKTIEIRKTIAAAVDEICKVFEDGIRTWME